jgi:hypothetical protein
VDENWQGKPTYAGKNHMNFASDIISRTLLGGVTTCSLVITNISEGGATSIFTVVN